MNSRFEKWKKQLEQPDISQETLNATLEELHKSFAFLSQEEQKYANLFLHDVQTGDVKLQEGVTFQDYIYQYRNYIFFHSTSSAFSPLQPYLYTAINFSLAATP